MTTRIEVQYNDTKTLSETDYNRSKTDQTHKMQSIQEFTHVSV